jgi:hypothetical protein
MDEKSISDMDIIISAEKKDLIGIIGARKSTKEKKEVTNKGLFIPEKAKLLIL